MTTVTGLTAARMLAIEAASVVSGAVDGSYHLILTKHDATTIDAGNVRGPQGTQGPQGVGPAGAAGGELAGAYPNPTLSGTLASARVLTWGGDTNLYRGGADVLKTDDQLYAVGQLIGSLGANQVNVGGVGPGSLAGVSFGNAGDTNLYRSAADILKTDDALVVSRYMQITNEVYVDMGNTAKKLYFGSAGDTGLYRSAASILRTDQRFDSADRIFAKVTAASQVFIGDAGPGSEAGIAFGSAADAALYRSAANTLKSDNNVVFGTGTVRGRLNAYYSADASSPAFSANQMHAALVSPIAEFRCPNRADNSSYMFWTCETSTGVHRNYLRGDGALFLQNTTVQSASDQALKENVEDLEGCLERVLALRPVEFDWNGKLGKEGHGRGFIAQEVDAIAPYATDVIEGEEDETYMSVGEAAFIPDMIGAIKNLQAQIDTLKG